MKIYYEGTKGGKRFRKAVCTAAVFFLTIILLAGLIAPAVYGTTESSKLQKRAELVVFIRFQGEPEFVSGTEYDPIITLEDGSQIKLNDWYNSATMNSVTDPSLNQYVQKITYDGKLVKPIYASASPDGIASYECNTKGSESDFNNTEWFQNIQREALKAIEPNLPEGVQLDYDNDARIDNVMFLWGPSDNRSWINWLVMDDHSRAHQGTMSMKETIKGKFVYSYVRNFIYSKASWMSKTADFNKRTLVHEYMHTLGVPDLYEEESLYSDLFGSSSIPVGDWDIQSATDDYGSTFLSQRHNHMKLGTFGEITKSGTYALYDVNEPNPSNGVNGYRIRSGSEDEYFVIEYRRGDTDPSAKKYGDGILVYRVKEDEYGNVTGDEEVHLFGEIPGLNSSASIANSKNGIGNPINGGILTNNELSYTDGTNSGVYIRNVGKAGETITFDVFIP